MYNFSDNSKIEKHINYYGESLLGIILILNILPHYFLDTQSNMSYAIYKLSFYYVSLPISIIIFYISIFHIPAWKRRNGNIKTIFYAFCFVILAILTIYSHTLSFNVLIGKQKSKIINGKITYLSISYSKHGKSYYLKVKEKKTNKIYSLNISGNEYYKLKINTQYSKEWKIGSLGLLYKTN